jgi:predicted DNA-binding transcriptional regulator YafY
MPDRHEKLAQALDLILTLSGSRMGLTIRELEQQLGVGRRTVERLLAAIGQACGTLEPVETGEREKRWRMRPTPITRAVAITAEEIAEIEAAARRLEDGDALPERGAILRSAAQKLRAAASETTLRRAEPDIEALLAAEGLAAQPGPRVELPEALIATLRRAILGSRVIRVSYRAARQAPREHLLEPVALLYGLRPYLLAVARGKEDAAVWRLDRISALAETNEGFALREGLDVATLMADCFGVWREPPFEVALRFSPAAAEEARLWRFHRSQQAEADAEGGWVVRFRAGGLEEMAVHLVRWGSDVEVRSPPELRERLARLGEALLAAHSA